MVRQANLLFNAKTIKRLCQDVVITNKQKEAVKEWLKLLDENKLEDEKKNYFRFGQIILQDILGYPIKEVDFESDNVEFQFANSEGKKMLCFEAKGTSTKDLFSPQHRQKKEHETPIKQTGDYMMSIGLDYGICTNYKDFVLITKEIGYSKYHKFDFESIKSDEEKLKEFVGIFSKERLIDKGFVKKLYHESIIEEREFTKEFYKLFHETRLMLIKTFQEHPDVTKEEAIRYAQLYLNRIIFMFFSEDNGLIYNRLFSTRIQEALKSPLISEHSKSISDEILNLFSALNKGSNILGIYGFNGGLFDEIIPPKIYFTDLQDPKSFSDIRQNSTLSNKLKLDDFSAKIIKKYSGQLNPIITNFLIMDSFDFTSEVNVNILGHIFEQSISDLEELRGEGVSKRKKEGVYYTPEYITDYICRNTIIPYLSKNNVTTVTELIKEYAKNIDELEKKIKKIKILDPACGSGAFLIKAVDILLEIDEEIQNQKHRASDFQITEFSEEKEITKIIQDNIFGVDINEESAEITKLSLFLKLASPNKKLIDLSKNIRIGNSLIEDKNVDQRAFSWDDEFPEVMKFGKFDIVIGNPPYVRQELIQNYQEFLKKNYESFSGKADLYVYFFEKASKLLKENGYLSFISSGKFLEANYGKQLSHYLFSNLNVKVIISFGDLEVFQSVTAYPLIFIAQNNKPEDYSFSYYKIDKLDFSELPLKIKTLKPRIIDINDFRNNDYKVVTKHIASLLNKISKNSASLREICGLPLVGIKTGYNLAYITENNDSQLIKPYVLGRDIKKYAPIVPKTKVIFPYVYEDSSYELIDIAKFPDIEKLLEPHRNRLEKRAIIKEGIRKKIKKWYEYQQINKNLNFGNEYIVNPDVSLGNNFTLSKGNVMDMTGFIIPTNDKYVLAVLNSKIVNFIMKLWASTIRGGYLRYKVQYLEKIPIKNASENKRKIIIDNVNSIMLLQKELYSKKEKFMNRVNSAFKPTKFTKKIEDFFTMNFIDFLNEIQKVSDVKLSLNEQDEWQDYFDKYKLDLNQLQYKIKKTDSEIDLIIYEIYELNDQEIQMIEEHYS